MYVDYQGDTTSPKRLFCRLGSSKKVDNPHRSGVWNRLHWPPPVSKRCFNGGFAFANSSGRFRHGKVIEQQLVMTAEAQLGD